MTESARSKQCAVLCRSITGIVGSNPQKRRKWICEFLLYLSYPGTFATEDHHTDLFCRIHITTNLVEYSEYSE